MVIKKFKEPSPHELFYCQESLEIASNNQWALGTAERQKWEDATGQSKSSLSITHHPLELFYDSIVDEHQLSWHQVAPW
jgi:hypothetical protein